MTKNISLSHIVFHLNITHSSHRQQLGISRTSPFFLLLTDHVTRSVILTEEHRLRVFENRMLRKTFGSKKDEVMGGGEHYIMGSLLICIPHQILFG